MSLINKMLQDLDARGTPGSDSFPSHVTPVAPEPRGPSRRVIAACVGAALASLALAWYGGHRWLVSHPVRAAAAPAAVPATVPVVVPGLANAHAGARQDPRAMSATITPLAAPAAARAALVPPPGAIVAAAPESGATSPAPAPAAAPTTHPDAAAAPASVPARNVHTPARARDADPAFDTVTPKSVAPLEPDSAAAREARQAATIELATRGARMKRLARLSAAEAPASRHRSAKGKTPAEGRQENAAQRAENEYRRGLASLQEGRINETVAALQAALRIDPGHEAARQTLVGLLVEGGRAEDAIRELQLGLAQDPRQPAMAMLLARLQIERGASGIETLQRTLPYVGNGTGESAEYHAFLAGALQRQQRQHEAAEQYQQALRAAPANGVWWMGLGISLQADKRNAEALEAFQKARASASLTPELQAFVERRIEQLAR